MGKKKRKPGRPATGKTKQRCFRMGDDDYELVEQAAEESEANVSEFIRDTLLAKAKRVLGNGR